MPLLNQEEEKKQEAPREEAVEYIDTSSNPQPYLRSSQPR
jgi:hypothetical protein